MKRGTAWRAVVIALFLLFMIVPVIATALFSVATRWDRSIWPEGLTLAAGMTPERLISHQRDWLQMQKDAA